MFTFCCTSGITLLLVGGFVYMSQYHSMQGFFNAVLDTVARPTSVTSGQDAQEDATYFKTRQITEANAQTEELTTLLQPQSEVVSPPPSEIIESFSQRTSSTMKGTFRDESVPYSLDIMLPPVSR